MTFHPDVIPEFLSRNRDNWILSSPDCGEAVVMKYKFPSRNQEALLVKAMWECGAVWTSLLIRSFHLGIENIFFSTMPNNTGQFEVLMFQSRNQDTYIINHG